jgi:hypothetical protein
MTAGRPSARRSLAVAAFTSALLAILVAAGGCELAIGDTVPTFYCTGEPGACPQGQVCDLNTNKCVVSCLTTRCGSGQYCDGSSGFCKPIPGDGGGMPDVVVNEASGQDVVTVDSTDEDSGSRPDTGNDMNVPCPSTGAPALCGCSGASQCASGVCADSLAVGSALYKAAGKSNFCTTPCCTSKDCPPGTVCYATGQGGDYCVNPAWIGRTTPAGTTAGGGNCYRNADCRSGLCSGNYCVDTCCSTPNGGTDCAGGDACQVGSFPGANSVDQNFAAYCAFAPSANGQDGSSCNNNSSCQSNLCAMFSGEVSSSCRDACRSDGDCTGNDTCSYVITSQTSTPTPIVAACAPPAGSAAMGTTCDVTTNCKGFCDPTSMQCTAPCFSDSDCSAVSGWHCRLEVISLSSQGGGSYEVLACQD